MGTGHSNLHLCHHNIVGFNAEITSQISDYPYYSPSPSGALVIPSIVSYNGTTYPVTSIGYSAFLNCSGLTSVTVPSSVTYIDVAAFANCNSLTSITSYSVFPPDQGEDAFKGVDKNIPLNVPAESVQTISQLSRGLTH